MAEKDTELPVEPIAEAVEEKATPKPRTRKPRTTKTSSEKAGVAADKPKTTRTRKPKAAVAVEPSPETVEQPPTVDKPAIDVVDEPLIAAVETAESDAVYEETANRGDEIDEAEANLREVFGDDVEFIDDPHAKENEAAKESAELADEVYEEASNEVFYSTNGVVLSPGYWQAWAGKGGRLNVFAWLGLVFSVIFFPLGLLFSGIGFYNTRAVPDDKFHKVLAGVGLGVSAFFGFMVIIPLLVWLLLGAVSVAAAPFWW